MIILPVTSMTRQSKQIIIKAFNGSLLKDIVNSVALVQLSHVDFFLLTGGYCCGKKN